MSGAPRWRAFRSAQRLHAFLRVLPAPLDAARFGLAAGAAAILRLRFATPARAGAAAGRFGAFFARAAGFDLAAPRGRCGPLLEKVSQGICSLAQVASQVCFLPPLNAT